ncbi:hypothetical protein KsCSTR_21320 [Candidatus Kuenenia stuttgartiensis]|uniref:Uncharacterized protein n=1 Tax=Kuenenia stuttgartiensis TaxID=174633 RepID=Q1Q314_KUEST|nr:hypothetical protein KsCSTR_21320 [Candidatus Kuenenia stuttgartiensis]CAJ74404.1 unknown protein [Candidatus Kuenenia stuttgartiensis]
MISGDKDSTFSIKLFFFIRCTHFFPPDASKLPTATQIISMTIWKHSRCKGIRTSCFINDY